MKSEPKYIEEIKMETNEMFECLVIKPGTIKNVSWFDPKYLDKLIELDLFESVQVNADNFIKILATKLQVPECKNVDLYVKTEIVGEEPYYVYELLYMDLEKVTEFHTETNLNELGGLINTNGDQIYFNAILFKNHLPSLSDSMRLCTVTKNDIKQLLFDRINTKIVIYDDGYKETTVSGDLNNYAKDFFDNEPFQKIEIPFLMHNINIWYTKYDIPNTTNKTNTTNTTNKICGKIINKQIDKCIWFTMKSDEYRGNLSLEEVNKIIYLSNKLNTYQTPEKLLEEKNDSFGRKIIFNKYKALDYMYNLYK